MYLPGWCEPASFSCWLRPSSPRPRSSAQQGENNSLLSDSSLVPCQGSLYRMAIDFSPWPSTTASTGDRGKCASLSIFMHRVARAKDVHHVSTTRDVHCVASARDVHHVYAQGACIMCPIPGEPLVVHAPPSSSLLVQVPLQVHLHSRGPGGRQ